MSPQSRLGHWNVFSGFASSCDCFLLPGSFLTSYKNLVFMVHEIEHEPVTRFFWNPLLYTRINLLGTTEYSLLGDLTGRRKGSEMWPIALIWSGRWWLNSATPSCSRVSMLAKTNSEYLSAYKSSTMIMHLVTCVPLAQFAQMRNFSTECRR